MCRRLSTTHVTRMEIASLSADSVMAINRDVSYFLETSPIRKFFTASTRGKDSFRLNEVQDLICKGKRYCKICYKLASDELGIKHYNPEVWQDD